MHDTTLTVPAYCEECGCHGQCALVPCNGLNGTYWILMCGSCRENGGLGSVTFATIHLIDFEKEA